jgi:itaconyl-CoA hydratase
MRRNQVSSEKSGFWKGTQMPGRYYEDLEVGQRIRHSVGRTITEMDNVLFCALTMNTQPLHLDENYAAKTQFGQRIVNGLFTLGLAVGLSVAELTEGTIVANLGYDRVVHPHPVFHGDTLYVESEVLEKRSSKSRPDAGLVRLKHVGRKQDGTVVVEFERTALFLKRAGANRAGSEGEGGATLPLQEA